MLVLGIKHFPAKKAKNTIDASAVVKRILPFGYNICYRYAKKSMDKDVFRP